MNLVINDHRWHAKKDAELLAHPIPPMTHHLSSGWRQPNRQRILIDKTHALMSKATFEELMEYSGTQPTGAYEGKMWRRHDGIFDRAFMAGGGVPRWMLCWYSPSERYGPGWVQTNYRLIILSDGELPKARP